MTHKRLQVDHDSPTTIAAYGLAIARALEYKGVDSRRVFRAAGLSEALTNDPLQRISIEGFTRLLKVCREVTHDPYFGLSVGRFVHASNMHALGYALMASNTLMDLCERLTRYFRLISARARLELIRSQRDVRLKVVDLIGGSAESEDALVSFVIRIMRLLQHSDFKPLKVEMSRAQPPEGDAPYTELLRCPVSFGNSALVMAFDRLDLEKPLSGSCPELAQFNDNIAANYLAKLDKGDIVAVARAKIIDLLPSGRCSQIEVARQLGLSVTTFKQKMARRNTSYRQLLNSLREEFSRGYLSQPNLSVTEVTFLLGFTDVSNFTRAFKRWTGVSPSDFRKDG
jgi:AraC-like DNA-binding protein